MAGRWTIIVMPVILFAAALISMLWFQGQAVTHAQEHTFETLRISAQDQTLIFNDRLEKQFDVLSVLALSLSQNEDISADALYSLLRETGGLTNFRDILVARADGVAYASDGTIVFIGDRAYFHTGMEGMRAIESVNSRRSGAQVFVTSVPIQLAGKVEGVLLGILDREGFLSRLINQAYGGQGYLFVCDEQGGIIIGNDQEGDLVAGGNVLTLLENETFSTGSLEKFRDDLAGKASGIVSYTREGTKKYAVYQPIGVNGWTIVTVVDGEAADASVHQTTRSGYVIVLVIMLISFSFVLLIYAINRRQRVKLQYDATHDSLTGLDNRRAFVHKTEMLVRQKPAGSYCIVSIDIENFKVINDQLGHEAGDALLNHVAQCLRAHFNASNESIACHDSADLFLVLTSASIALERSLQECLDDMERVALPMRMTPRFGLYVIDAPGLAVGAMIDRAMLAQRTVKGMANVHMAYYDEKIRTKLLNEQEIVEEMQSALESGQFTVYLQPQYNQVSNEVMGVEALVRWRHPGKGMVPPGEFIPIFEKNGFIVQLDQFVWEESCKLLRKWMDDGLAVVPVSVNVSRMDIYELDLCVTFSDLLARYRLRPELLRLEITESAYMENASQLIEVVERLRDQGFCIEMDDFGSSYSSLNTLKDVPVDMLKLDMRFLVSENKDDDRSGIILHSIVRMARWLNIPVMAEGVETVQQAAYLKSIGCRYVQGYLFARPMPAEAFYMLLQDAKIGTYAMEMEHVNVVDGRELWNPQSQVSLFFNTLIGPAGIFEYRNGNLEALRLNNRFFEETVIAREAMQRIKDRVLDAAVFEDRFEIDQMLCDLEQNDREEMCEARWRLGNGRIACLRVRAITIARCTDSFMLYAAIESIVEEKQDGPRGLDAGKRR